MLALFDDFLKKYYRREQFTEEGVQVLIALSMLLAFFLFTTFPDMPARLACENPQFVRLIIKMWHLSATQQVYHPSGTPIPLLFKRKYLDSCTLLVQQVMCGGYVGVRRAVQSGFLSTFRILCDSWPEPEDETAEYETAAVASLMPMARQYLSHYSFLRIVMDALGDKGSIMIYTSPVAVSPWRRDTFYVLWDQFLEHFHSRKLILVEWDEKFVSGQLEFLCDNRTVNFLTSEPSNEC